MPSHNLAAPKQKKTTYEKHEQMKIEVKQKQIKFASSSDELLKLWMWIRNNYNCNNGKSLS